MASLDTNVIITVTTDAPPVPAAGFGVPLFVPVPGTLGGGFTERVRFYESSADAAADVTSGDITATAKAAIDSVFAQNPSVSKVGIGRVDAGVAQVSTVTVAGAILDGENFTVTVDGHTVSYNAVVPADDQDAVAAALEVLLDALPITHVTFSVLTNVITCTGVVGGVPFVVATTTDSAGATITPAETTPASLLSTELDALFAEESDWYTITSEQKTQGFVEALAAWTESNERLCVQDVNAPNCLTAATDDVLSVLKANGYTRTAAAYYSDDTEELSFTVAGKKLEADPDARTTAWAYTRCAGIVADSMTSTEKANVLGKNGNVYLPFFSFASYWKGTTADGSYIDVLITRDWVSARMGEGIAQLFLNEYNANRKVPFNDEGITQVASVLRDVLARGVNAGHFNAGATRVDQPKSADVSAADKTARLVRIPFVAELAGAIQEARITGAVVIELPA